MFTFFYDTFNAGIGDSVYVALDWKVKDRRDYSFQRAARYYYLKYLYPGYGLVVAVATTLVICAIRFLK